MKKIALILSREYITRVRKRSFIIMSILGPILFASLMIIPIWVTQMEDTDIKRIAIIDSSHIFRNVIQDGEYLKFDYLENTSLTDLKDNFSQTGYYGILYISHIVSYDPNSVILYSDKQPNLGTKLHISRALENYIKDQKLQTYEIDDLDAILRAVETNINIRTIKLSEGGGEKESNTGIAMALGYISGFLMYMFLLFLGTQVMRGVLEEKTNRIVEIIISSVKPFQLMLGKIVGIALVGLTQLLIWSISTVILVMIAQAIFFPELGLTPTEQVVTQDVMSANPVQTPAESSSPEMEELRMAFATLGNINFAVMIGSFLFYFLGGFFLYASLFAAVGAAVDNDTDTQQFIFPILIPLILSIIILFSIINTPGSPIAFWFSIIPFTSPIIMMARIPFGVPMEQVILSMVLLVAFFIGTVWLAGKIYRTGILMYGKKVNYKELWKWIRYKT